MIAEYAMTLFLILKYACLETTKLLQIRIRNNSARDIPSASLLHNKAPFKKYVCIELGQSTAEDIWQCPCGLNPHGHRQVSSALRKYSLENKLEMKIVNSLETKLEMKIVNYRRSF